MRHGIGLAALLLTLLAVAQPVAAQGRGNAPAFYKPPASAPPSRRVVGISRGAETPGVPRIDLVAPDGHAGETISEAPTLYYLVSGPAGRNLQLTISAPRRAAPLLTANLPAPRAAGLYAVDLADYHVRLQPGVVYIWSVSVAVDQAMPSDDVVAQAALLRQTPDPPVEAAARAASPAERARLFAQAGLWYDAVAAAEAARNIDRGAALNALLQQVGLGSPQQSAGRS